MSKYYALILQDLIIQKSNLFYFILIPLGVLAYLKTNSLFIIIFLSYFQIQFLTINACGQEESNKSRIIYNCLPLNKRHIVLSKYLSVFVYYLLVVCFYYIILLLIQLLGLLETDINISDFILILTLVTSSVILFYPLYFSLGYSKASAYSTLIPMLFIMFDLVKMDSISKSDETSFESIRIILNSNAELKYILLSLVLVVCIISYHISLKLYKKQDL